MIVDQSKKVLISVMRFFLICLFIASTVSGMSGAVNSASNCLTRPFQSQNTIRYGETVQGEAVDDQGETWLFQGRAGDTISISMISDIMDSVLDLHGPDGDLLASNDESASNHAYYDNYLWDTNHDALIQSYTLSSSGLYAITATGYRGSTGPYILRLILGEGKIVYGETVRGELATPSSKDMWQFDGNQGDVVAIFSESDSYVLELRGHNDSLLATSQNDMFFSVIPFFTLPETGQYQIVVASSSDPTGLYELSLRRMVLTPPGKHTIAYGEIVSRISNSTIDTWDFTGNLGDTASIVAYSDSGITLELYDPDQNLLFTTEFHDRIEKYTLPKRGKYTVTVTSQDVGELGFYRLYLTQVDTKPFLRGVIEYGETVGGSIGNMGAENWSFTGRRGDVISITMDGGYAGSYLRLFDMKGNELTDQTRYEGQSLIESYILPEDGTYTIIAQPYDAQPSSERMSYLLSLSGTKINGYLSYGETIQEVLEQRQKHRWQFEGARGNAITIDLSGDFDTYLEIYAPTGQLLKRNDDGGTPDLNSRIEDFELPVSGTYTVLVRGYGEAHGHYSLSLDGKMSPTPLTEWRIEYGQTAAGLITTAEGDRWSFSGAQGDFVDIEVLGSKEYELYNSRGERLDPVREYGYRYLLPDTGKYQVVVKGTPGPYTLSLSSAPFKGEAALGQIIHGQTTTVAANRWGISAQEGEYITVSVVSRHWCGVDISASDGEIITSDTKEMAMNTSGRLEVVTFQAPKTGNYMILASPSGDSDYWLRVEQGSSVTGDFLDEVLPETNRHDFVLRSDEINFGYNVELEFGGAGGEPGWSYPGDPEVHWYEEYELSPVAVNQTGRTWSLSGFEPNEPLRLLFLEGDNFVAERSIVADETGRAIVVVTIPASAPLRAVELIVVNHENHILRYNFHTPPKEPCPPLDVSSLTWDTRMIVGYQGELVANVQSRQVWDTPLGQPTGEITSSDTFDVVGDAQCTVMYDRDGTFKSFYWWPVAVHGSGLRGWVMEGRDYITNPAFSTGVEPAAWIRPLFLPNVSGPVAHIETPVLPTATAISYRTAITLGDTRTWSEPNVETGHVVITLTPGTRVLIISGPVQGPISLGSDDQGDWYQVQLPTDNAPLGWIWSGLLELE